MVQKFRSQKDLYDDVVEFYSSIDAYVETHPELKEYSLRFQGLIEKRYGSIRRRLGMACNLLKIKAEDKSYGRVLKQIIKLYPTWDDIKNSLVKGGNIRFPEDDEY